ncbi:MAG: GntR family transcriptional regulator [Lachnospiraceae bacterium]|nr:GntR family transcriptional regulator [Lachnospiraceae bacterium]
MTWNLKEDRPIYVQIVETLRMRIVSGVYPPGSRIPSVRELAAEAGVNPNTMQRALADLERMELISTQRTTGKTVTEDESRILSLKESIAEEETKIYFVKMGELGFDHRQIADFVKKAADGENNEIGGYTLMGGE